MTSLATAANSFIEALSSLDVDKMLALRTPDCQQIISPSSMERKPMSNNEFREMYTGYLALAKFSDYNITVHSTVVDEPQGKGVLHASGVAKTLAGPFRSEYIFILTVVDREGVMRISMVEEFVDSKLSAQEGAKIKAAIADASR